MGDKKKRCPRCHVGGYTQDEAPVDKRPRFTCSQCGHVWTQGKSGGKYALNGIIEAVEKHFFRENGYPFGHPEYRQERASRSDIEEAVRIITKRAQEAVLRHLLKWTLERGSEKPVAIVTFARERYGIDLE